MHWPVPGPAVPRRRNRLTRAIGRAYIRLFGWRFEGEWPNESKLIVAVAPHSSNVDFILAVAVFWGLELRTSYLAKHSLFWFPLGTLMRALGGIAVDRRSPQGMAGTMIDAFNAADALVLGITPEGTRGAVREWRRGFAHIAAGASVPVLPAIIDYAQRVVHLRPVIAGATDADQILNATRAAAQLGVPRRAAS